MSKKKLENSESVIVDVDTTVTSVTGVPVKSEPSVELPSESSATKRKSPKIKKVAEIAVEEQIADLEVALEKAKDAVAAAAADNERLADSLGVSVAENKSLRKELSKCKQDYKKCQSDNRANSALVETLDGELTRLKVRNKELLDTISALQGKIKQYADELSVKEMEIGTLDFECKELDGELERFKAMTFLQRIKFLIGGRKVFMPTTKD